jgi:hypothetical protein
MGPGGTSMTTLYFNVGPNQEQDGLFASISLATGDHADAARRVGETAALATVSSSATPRFGLDTDLLSANTAQERQSVPPLVEDVRSELAAVKASLQARSDERLHVTSSASQREHLDLLFSSAELEQGIVLA